jgi:putative transcriptional regulator
MSKTTITAKMGRDGRLTINGRKRASKSAVSAKLRAMSDAEVEAAAKTDPDNPPLTKARLAKLTKVPRIKTLRRALALTQEEFAARYRIPVGTLRDWEQGRSEPDQPARAYLKVIARDPEAVRAALKR